MVMMVNMINSVCDGLPTPPKHAVDKDFSIIGQCRVNELGHLHEVPDNDDNEGVAVVCPAAGFSCKSMQVSLHELSSGHIISKCKCI